MDETGDLTFATRPVPDADAAGGWRDAVCAAPGEATSRRAILTGALASSYGTDSRRPFLWSGGALTGLPVPEETQEAWAWAVNDRGDVCGWYLSHVAGYRACLWRARRRIDLPPADGATRDQATHVDNRGVVLSSYWRPGNESVDLYRVIGTTDGGSVTSGGSTGGSSTGGTSTSGGSTIEGATDDGATTGGTPGCHASLYDCVQWTVRS